MRQSSASKLSSLGIVLAFLHLLLVGFVYSRDYEGSWGGMILLVADLPVSLLLALPIPMNQWLFFGIVGTVWWYWLGTLFAKLTRKRIA